MNNLELTLSIIKPDAVERNLTEEIKEIFSKNADMQNINYVGGAGSTTAAQFLQRFVLNKTPWAHLDIAGMAFSKYGGALNSGGATGYGVRLLNKLIEEYYE